MWLRPRIHELRLRQPKELFDLIIINFMALGVLQLMRNNMGTSTNFRLFVGVDISATTAAVSWTNQSKKLTSPLKINQTPKGYQTLQKKLSKTGFSPSQVLIVMEATGSYWISMATVLQEAGYVVSVINPAQAHYFAKALLKRSKTDAIDAQTLAQLAAVLQPEAWEPPPYIYHQLQQRLVHRASLLNIQNQISNQLHAHQQNPAAISAIRSRMQGLLETVKKQIAEIEEELEELVFQDSDWAISAHLLLGIKGIGLITTAWLLVTTLNFTTSENVESLTAYAGLAPALYQSGSSVWHKPTIGHTGNKRLRTALYLATLSATQSNPIIKGFYDRLRAAGKPMKVARCAAARKLLHIAWAVVKKKQAFDPEYGTEILPAEA